MFEPSVAITATVDFNCRISEFLLGVSFCFIIIIIPSATTVKRHTGWCISKWLPFLRDETQDKRWSGKFNLTNTTVASSLLQRTLSRPVTERLGAGSERGRLCLHVARHRSDSVYIRLEKHFSLTDAPDHVCSLTPELRFTFTAIYNNVNRGCTMFLCDFNTTLN